MNLGRILTMILLTGAMLLVGGAIAVGMVILTDKTSAVDRRPPLPGQHTLELSKRPACTWAMPAIIMCYHSGLRTHPELRLVYHTPSTRQVLLSFDLPDR